MAGTPSRRPASKANSFSNAKGDPAGWSSLISAAKTRTRSAGSRRPTTTSVRAGLAGRAGDFADRQALDLELVDLARLLAEGRLERRPGVEAADRGGVDGRDLAGFEVPLESEPDEVGPLASLIVGLAGVRADRVEVPLRVAGHPLELGPRRGRRRQGVARHGGADDLAGRRLDNVEFRRLVVGDQDELAVADRLDGGRLDPGVDLDRLRRAGARPVKGTGSPSASIRIVSAEAAWKLPVSSPKRIKPRLRLRWDIGIVSLRHIRGKQVEGRSSSGARRRIASEDLMNVSGATLGSGRDPDLAHLSNKPDNDVVLGIIGK